LFSPITGVVSSVNGTAGTKLAAGQPCLTVIDPQSYVARGEMTQRQAEVILAGDPALLALGSEEQESKVRVVYPDTDGNPFNLRPFEVEIADQSAVAAGKDTQIKIETEQVLPVLVPFETLVLEPGKGMAVRMVTGQGPTGRVRTLPITLVATAKEGFYVDGLPTEARLIVKDDEFTVPVDGTTVRIGRVGK
ncbi:MAG: HlyD family secretion protein, partial [Parvularculaceae bacterium]|nr:HlyD family secretion protein [Parvularculaceae bacterium]